MGSSFVLAQFTNVTHVTKFVKVAKPKQFTTVITNRKTTRMLKLTQITRVPGQPKDKDMFDFWGRFGATITE